MKALLAGGLAVTTSAPLALGALTLAAASDVGPGYVATTEALDDIPDRLLRAYVTAAETCPGLPWPVLAAIGKVESGHARGGASLTDSGEVQPPIVGPPLDGARGRRYVPDTDEGNLDGDPVLDRAVGPMQFLPDTWRRWGVDATGDGTADPHNAFDAVATAAAYLCGPDGEIGDLEAGLLRYNRSQAYVSEVLAIADRYGIRALPAFLDPGPAAVLSHPNLTFSGSARRDLESGLVDPRVVAMLSFTADHFEIEVGVVKTRHSQCVGGGSRATRPGCRISHHFEWRAVDIVSVAGRPVTATNTRARALAEFLVRLPAPLRPDELGVPWPALTPVPGVFSDQAHQGHIHAGFEPLASP